MVYFILMNYMFSGEAIYLQAKVPHAYLSGDCIECMACSDNVVRAGLTPKFKDLEVLLEMLDYEGAAPSQKLFQPTNVDASDHKYTWMFKPPIKDFAVCKIQLPGNVKNYNFQNNKYGSILLMISGTATLQADGMKNLDLKRGKIIFLPSKIGPNVQLKDVDSKNEDFICYQAMFNA